MGPLCRPPPFFFLPRPARAPAGPWRPAFALPCSLRRAAEARQGAPNAGATPPPLPPQLARAPAARSGGVARRGAAGEPRARGAEASAVGARGLARLRSPARGPPRRPCQSRSTASSSLTRRCCSPVAPAGRSCRGGAGAPRARQALLCSVRARPLRRPPRAIRSGGGTQASGGGARRPPAARRNGSGRKKRSARTR